MQLSDENEESSRRTNGVICQPVADNRWLEGVLGTYGQAVPEAVPWQIRSVRDTRAIAGYLRIPGLLVRNLEVLGKGGPSGHCKGKLEAVDVGGRRTATHGS